MHRARPFAVVSLLAVLFAVGACATENTDDEDTGDTSSALTGYSRQTVYTEMKPHAKAAKDLLSSSVTDPRLVSAIGWLHDNAPGFTVSAIRSDHHNDGSNLHAGGFCADLYANSPSDMKKFLQSINSNPWVAEIGLGGSYKNLRSSVTHKAVFDDNGQTHVHIGVKKTAGACKVTHCDGEASVSAANNTSSKPATTSAPVSATSAPSTTSSSTSTGDDDDDDDDGAVPLPPERPADLGTCASFTLQQNVVPGTCVQRADDDNWYVCDGNDLASWPQVDSPLDPQCEVCPQLDDGQCAESI